MKNLKISKNDFFWFLFIIILYVIAILYVYFNNLSWGALFKAGILQPKGITGIESRIIEIDTPLSGNILLIIWYIILKGAALLVELLPYWIIGMFIAAILVVFVSWEKIKEKLGYGGFVANFIAFSAGAIIPICSCGIAPVLAGMIGAGVPLGPTLAFLIAAPMLNIPSLFMTATLLGKNIAIARLISVFIISMSIGLIISYWQKKRKGLRHLVKIYVQPNLSDELQKFAYTLAIRLSQEKDGLTTDQLGIENKEKLEKLEEAEIIENINGKWYLINRKDENYQSGCMVLPQGYKGNLKEKIIYLWETAWKLFFNLNYYLVLAVIIAGAIKVLIPTQVIVNFVGGKELNSVLISSVVSLLAYVCTYVEVPTALALISKGMGPGATLVYLLAGPGLSLPSIILLSSVFRKKLLLLYVGFTLLLSIIAGYIYNLLV